ncbi:uncharacterized protein DS421_5g143970 [Arachis hypogaea]|nr:uncharacterized protein DS421_5g143970 [Arachis hypogaea]
MFFVSSLLFFFNNKCWIRRRNPIPSLCIALHHLPCSRGGKHSRYSRRIHRLP